MNRDEAEKRLEELRDSINKVLGSEPTEDKKETAIEFRDSAKEDKGSFFRRLTDKASQLPVVDTFSQLGVAGSVAVSSAFVTQADLAKDSTEVFVAEIANDVVEEKIVVPQFINDFVDFHELNTWGEIVIAERFVEAQTYVGKVSEQIVTKIENGDIEVTKPSTVSSSQSSSDDKTSEPQERSTPQKVEAKEQTETKESSESKEVKEVVKEESSKESSNKEELSKSSQENKNVKVENVKEEVKQETNQPEDKVDSIPKVETPDIDMMDNIKPHSLVVPSPVS